MERLGNATDYGAHNPKTFPNGIGQGGHLHSQVCRDHGPGVQLTAGCRCCAKCNSSPRDSMHNCLTRNVVASDNCNAAATVNFLNLSVVIGFATYKYVIVSSSARGQAFGGTTKGFHVERTQHSAMAARVAFFFPSERPPRVFRVVASTMVVLQNGIISLPRSSRHLLSR